MPPKKQLPEQPPPMDNSNVTVIEFGENTLQAIRELTQAIATQKAPVINLKSVDSDVLENLVAGLVAVAQPMKLAAPVAQATQPAPKQTAMKAETKATPTSGVTLTQIREQITALVTAGKKTKAAALLQEYGVANAQSLSEDQYDNFYDQLINL